MSEQGKQDHFIEVVFVARVLIHVDDIKQRQEFPEGIYDHHDAADYLTGALSNGIRECDVRDKLLDSTTYMAGEFRDAIREEDVAGGIGL